ncbi:putative peroxisomal dehydratase [Gorgonomyces haynaldii]|nr:putative peroxisomal dehydratase [Gorgonomyces haynaldii]
MTSLAGFKYPTEKVQYNKRELILYALGIGARDLKYTYELDPQFQAFPTYALVLPLKGSDLDVNSYAKRTANSWNVPGMPKFDLNRLVHGEQQYELVNPLPLGGTFDLETTLKGVYDLGKSMVIETESVLKQNGVVYCKQTSTAFVIGAGGFGGPKPPKKQTIQPPSRDPDFTTEQQLSEDQALLYRLSGDYNPLHADPRIGKKLGMKGAILHGLCTFGHAANAVIGAYKQDPKHFKSISGRFASPVYPGEKLVTRMWKHNGLVSFECSVNGKPVLTNGVVTFTSAKL